MPGAPTFDEARWLQPPVTCPAPALAVPGVESLYFDHEPYQGRPTRVFAYLGLPYVAPGASCPGMVLLHGGGGTAFHEWVRLWNRRGYAAIAIDQCGSQPAHTGWPDGKPHPRHADAGPPGWGDSFQQVNEPLPEQWQYHAVSAAMRAHSLLAAQPGVDADRIGVTGISWGGYLTCLVAAADPRLKCAIPVYGCGFLGDNSAWSHNDFPRLPAADVARWLALWDPAEHLPRAGMPFCWLNGTNDFAYPLDSWQKSYQLPAGPRTLCLRPAMPHGHWDGWAPLEIGAFADSVLRAAAPPTRIMASGRDDGQLWAEFASTRPVQRAEICFTRATGFWPDRRYSVLPATVSGNRVNAAIPPKTTVCFLNLIDDGELLVSTPHLTLDPS